MPVTIRDISKRLNLSVAAVSRALSGYTDIAPDTRKRIIDTAREMGYTPNRAARQLRKQTGGLTLGYILPVDSPRFADSYFSEFIEGLGDETAAQHCDLLISTAPPGGVEEQSAYRQWIEASKVDFMILNRLQIQDWRVRYLAEKRVPFSTLERSSDQVQVDYPSVEIDSRVGMVELVNHIKQKGFRHFAFIGGPGNLKINMNRYMGLVTGLEQAGLSIDPQHLIEGDMTSAGGYDAGCILLSSPSRPDAILCVNDETAFGVLRAVDEAGLKTGIDVAVAGFEGVRDSRYSNPPLTTLNLPVYEVARQLARMLIDPVMRQAQPAPRIMVQPELLIRASTSGVSEGNSEF